MSTCLIPRRALTAGLVGTAALALAARPAADADAPLALHPANPHYFAWRGKPAVLITSGEHYGALFNLDFDFVRYFDALKADGLNLTRLFSGTYREVPSSFGITDNTLAPKPSRYACPWARSNEPGAADGGSRFDLSRWDDAYFARLDALMRAASERGVVVEFNLFCPLYDDALWAASPMNRANNVNGLGDCPRTEVLALKHPALTDAQVAFTRRVVQALNGFDNLYFEVCNEPYFGGVTRDWQNRIADTIAATEAALPRRHLVSMNVANGRAKLESPHPAVSIFNFHYCVPPDTVAINFGLGRVIGENETGFRGKDELLYRTEGWDFILAGGALFNTLDYSFTPLHPDGTFRDYRSPGGGSPELRRQLGILKRFVEGFDFVRMKPDDAAVAAVSDGLAARALAERGKAYAVYVHVPLPEKPQRLSELRRGGIRATVTLDLPAGRYRAEWLDTKTGAASPAEAFDHAGGRRELASPEFADDVALKVTTGGT